MVIISSLSEVEVEAYGHGSVPEEEPRRVRTRLMTATKERQTTSTLRTFFGSNPPKVHKPNTQEDRLEEGEDEGEDGGEDEGEDEGEDDQSISECEEDGDQHEQTELDFDAIIKLDDGQKRYRNTHRLSMCFSLIDDVEAEAEEAPEDSDLELTVNQLVAKINSKKVKRRRGPNKARDVAPLESRPKLKAVGDVEFEATPTCAKIVSTIRLLTLKHVPSPFRSYYLLPVEIRLNILRDFLKRYAWESNSKKTIMRYIDVFECIAFDAYRREQSAIRKKLRNLYGNDVGKWKANPPHWATTKKKVWEGLCDVWAKPRWQKVAKTNTANKAKDGGVVHHVAGSSSTHQVRKKVEKEKGSSDVSLKEVFDKMHKRKTPDGEVYCNAKAQQVVEKYVLLTSEPGTEIVEEMNVWKEAGGGEARGRIYGFGYRSISRVCPQSSMHYMTSPIKTTATGASQEGRYVTADELEKVLAQRDKQHAIELAKRDALIQKLLADRDN